MKFLQKSGSSRRPNVYELVGVKYLETHIDIIILLLYYTINIVIN